MSQLPQPPQRPSDKLAAHVASSMGGRMFGKQILSKVYNNVLEMMQDRGLRVTKSCQCEEELMQRIDDNKPILRAETEGGSKTFAFIDSEERTGVKLIRALRDEYGKSALCIINTDGATPFTKREVADCSHIEFWQVGELLMNPTKHALVPRHTALSDESVAEMQTRRCILPTQWPLILHTDIIVRWYKFPKGAIVRIERKGFAHERGDYYRKVV